MTTLARVTIFSSLRVWLTHFGDCPKAEVEHEVLREDGSDVSLGSQDGGAAFEFDPHVLG